MEIVSISSNSDMEEEELNTDKIDAGPALNCSSLINKESKRNTDEMNDRFTSSSVYGGGKILVQIRRRKSRETFEHHLNNIIKQSSRQHRRETPPKIIVEPRIRRKILEGSYANWTVKEDSLPKILRYTWKGKLKKLKNYLSTRRHQKHINKYDSRGRTALHYAASWGCVRTLKLLINIPGINLDNGDEHGKTALFKAGELGGYDAILTTKMLIQKGANPFIACSDSRDVFVYIMQEYGDDRLDLLTFLYHEGGIKEKYTCTPYTMSLLHFAMLTVRVPVKVTGIVKMLVEGKQDINAIEGAGRTPLMLAAMTQRMDVLQFLLMNGANIHHVDENNKSVRNYVKPGTRYAVISHNVGT